MLKLMSFHVQLLHVRKLCFLWVCVGGRGGGGGGRFVGWIYYLLSFLIERNPELIQLGTIAMSFWDSMEVSTMTLSIMSLSIMSLSKMSLSKMSLSIMSLSIMSLSIMSLSIMSLSIMSLSIMSLSLMSLRITPLHSNVTLLRLSHAWCLVWLNYMSLWWISCRLFGVIKNLQPCPILLSKCQSLPTGAPKGLHSVW